MVKLSIVGSLAYDSISTETGSTDDTLGGSATYAGFSAAGHLVRIGFDTVGEVGLVGVVGSDFEADDLSRMAARGLNLSGIKQESGDTFRWKGRYSGDMSQAETLDTQLNVFETFTPEVPPELQSPLITFCANMHPLIQASVLNQSSAQGFTAMDSMNLWIDIAIEELCTVLRRIDMAILNDAEVRMLANDDNLVRAGESIRSGSALVGGEDAGSGPRILIIKRGEHGVLALTPQGPLALPAFPTQDVVDPTGCGDSFAGAMLAHLATISEGIPDSSQLHTALMHGNVTASFTLGALGVSALEQLTREEYEQRFTQYSRMLQGT